jgi:hypothetical protein
MIRKKHCMSETSPDSTATRISVRSLFPFVFFPLYFLYVWLRIDPGLIYQEQESVFFFGYSFFRRFPGVPGGMTEYLSSFLSQFFSYGWAGALIITLIAAGVTWSVSAVTRDAGGSRGPRFIDYLPAIFLLMLHSHYKHPLADSVGYLLALAFSAAYIRLVPEVKALRLPAALVMSPALYLIAGGPFLLFASLCAFHELFLERGSLVGRLLRGLSVLLLSAAIPALFREILFMVTLKDAYTALLPFQYSYKPALAPHLLYAFPLLLVLLEAFARHRAGGSGRPVKENQSQRRKKAAHSRLAVLFSGRNPSAQAAGAVLVLLTAGAAAQISFDPVNHAILRVDHYARRQMWARVLRSVTAGNSEYGLVSFQVNRALYHLGLLPEKMFSYPQKLGINGLFFPGQYQYLIPLQVSDLFYEMGHVNEAQHWAHEAVSQKGETPWNCRRLVQTCLLKNEKEAAREYIALLKRTPLHRKWAERMERLADSDSLLNANEEMRSLRALMPDSDFVINSEEPYLDLDKLLSEHGNNRMAFEYVMASYLLKGKLGKFANRIGRLKDFQYAGIPKSYNEALMLYYVEKRRLPEGLSGQSMDAGTSMRYADFYKTLSRVGWNRLAAMGELQRNHFDTYWYYVSYFKPAADRENEPESPRGGGAKK